MAKTKDQFKPISSHKIFSEWHHEKNKHLDPNTVSQGSHINVWWKCSKGICCDHVWEAPIRGRTKRGFGCTCCSGRKYSWSNRLDYFKPELSLEWHPTKNKHPIGHYKKSDRGKVWWICLKNKKHEYEANIVNKVYDDSKCSYCSGRKVSPENSLLERYPEVAKELHPTLNKKSAAEMTYASHEMCIWQCSKNKKHPTWPSSVKNRTISENGCPSCRMPHASKVEIYLMFELMRFFKIDPMDKYLKIDNKIINYDIIIRSKKTIIEYDGYRYHKSKKRVKVDFNKNRISKGWKIYRVREYPLKKINKEDIIIKPRPKEPGLIKATAHICKLLRIKKNKIDQIKNQNRLENKQKAEIFINQILGGKINYIQKKGIDPDKILTVNQILEWSDIFFKKYKKYPGQTSKKKIKEMHKENWANIDAALRNGGRGLPKIAGLPGLLEKERDHTHNQNKTDLKIEEIIKWLKFEYKKTGEWPTAQSNKVLANPDEIWSNINSTLHNGGRGLKKGNSIAKIKKKIANII